MHISITNINRKFHARLYNENILLDEMACDLRCDIGFICREMLRWQDKINPTKQTTFARNRQTINTGKIYYIGLQNAQKALHGV